MTPDRYERCHRRTVRHPESISMMAGANFDAAPSLSEAMGLDMKYWQVERECSGGNCWVGTDFRVSGTTREDAEKHLADIAGRAGWTARLGRAVRSDDHYCDFAWVNAS